MDPRRNHPDFTPTEPPKKILGVELPAPEIREMTTPKSMWPKSIQHEAGIKVSVSLGFIGILVAGAYQMGNQRAVESEKIMAEIKDLKDVIDDNTKELTEARQECRQETRSVSNIESKISNIQAEILVMQSKLKH